MFRSNAKVERSTVALFKATVSALNAMQPYKGPVYFGQRLPSDYVANELKPGTDFFHNNFTSTSILKKEAEEFTQGRSSGEDEDVGVLFEVQESCNRMYIGQYSDFPFEREILFRPLHPFRITEKVPPQGENGFWVVKMKENLPCPAQATTTLLTLPWRVSARDGTNLKIYPDPVSTKPVGVLAGVSGLFLNPVSKKGSRYEVFFVVRRAEQSWECLDATCFKQRMATGQPVPATIDGISGAEVKSDIGSKGVATAGLEMFGRGMDQANNKTEIMAYSHGFIEVNDVIVPRD